MRKVLEGRNVAVVGLGRAEMMEVTEALETYGAAWQAFSRADASALGSVDLVIAGSAAAAALAGLAIPMLIVGPFEEVSGIQLEPALGRDFIVAPPLHKDEVVFRASHLLADAAAQPKRPQAARTPVIVFADDDPTMTAIVRMVVSQNGMICHVAADGRRALEIARSVEPSLVILDVHMPFLDGFEVLSALRNDPSTAAVPVVMLTAVQQEADIVRAFSLGADDYVPKPFNPMELLARIQRLVKRQA